MKTYKMVLCYDGSRYNGWQKQGNTDNTLQEKLEKILTDIAGMETEIAGSGRTEAPMPKGRWPASAWTGKEQPQNF